MLAPGFYLASIPKHRPGEGISVLGSLHKLVGCLVRSAFILEHLCFQGHRDVDIVVSHRLPLGYPGVCKHLFVGHISCLTDKGSNVLGIDEFKCSCDRERLLNCDTDITCDRNSVDLTEHIACKTLGKTATLLSVYRLKESADILIGIIAVSKT